VGSAVSTSGEPPNPPPAFNALFSKVVGTLVRPEAYKYSVGSDVSTDNAISADENDLEDFTDTGNSIEPIETLGQDGDSSQVSAEEEDAFD
jgi:hypothetical protein